MRWTRTASSCRGPETVTGDDTPAAPQKVFGQGVPVLGICYGMQTMAAQLGGRVAASTNTNTATPRCVREGHSQPAAPTSRPYQCRGWGLLDVG